MKRIALIALMMTSPAAMAAPDSLMNTRSFDGCGAPSQMVVPQACPGGGVQTMTITFTPVRTSNGQCEVREDMRISGGCQQPPANSCFGAKALPYANQPEYRLLVVNEQGAAYSHPDHGLFVVPCPQAMAGSGEPAPTPDEGTSCQPTRTYAVETQCPSGNGVRRDFYYYFQTELNGQCVRASNNPTDGDYFSRTDASECNG